MDVTMNMKQVYDELGQYDTRTLLRAKQGQNLEQQQVYITTAPRGTIWESLDNKTRAAIIRLNRMRP
jgi:hypothetical protein